jgi:alpha-tubulin suppressor-like RCC1 family protein
VDLTKVDIPISGIPVTKDKIPDQLFKDTELTKEERLYSAVFIAHFLMMYKEAGVEAPIEFPTGMQNDARVLVQHVSDRLGLGSLTRGPKGKGNKKRIIVGLIEKHREKFEKAKKGRDMIIVNAIKQYKYKTFSPPQVTIRDEVYQIVDEQKENFKKGLDFTKSWQLIEIKSEDDMKKEVNVGDKADPASLPKDGKDWSLSTDEFKIYISGENKEVVNKNAFKEDTFQMDNGEEVKMYETEFINPLIPSWNQDDEDFNDSSNGEIDMEAEDSSPSDEKLNNICTENLNSLTLESFEGRPDKISEVRIVKVEQNSVELEWEVPEWNNAEITEYIVKWKEVHRETMQEEFKSVCKTEINKALIEDLTPNTWHVVDIRAINKYGYSPQSSSIVSFWTLKSVNGWYYAWGKNSNAELGLLENDIENTAFYRSDANISIGPIKSSLNFVSSVEWWEGESLIIVDKLQDKNLLHWGLFYDFNEEESPFVYNESDLTSPINGTPYLVGIPEKAAKIQCGIQNNLVLGVSGKVYTWGFNKYGQWGQQDSNMSNEGKKIIRVNYPQVVKGLLFKDDFIIDIAAGPTHCLALSKKQRVFMWGNMCKYPPGYERSPDLGLLSNNLHYPEEIKANLINYSPRKVIAGACCNGILTTDGKLLTFGRGIIGQLGHLDTEGKIYEFLYIPKRVDFFDDYFVEDAWFGYDHCLAIARKKIKDNKNIDQYELEEQRLVFSWGGNSKGQLGHGDTKMCVVPNQIEAFKDWNVLKIAAGENHSLFWAEKDGQISLYSCGDATNGATGLTKNLNGCFKNPEKVTVLDKLRKVQNSSELAEIIEISAGACTSFAIIATNSK